MTLSEFLLARISEDEAANDRMVRDEVARCRADGMPNTTESEIRAFWGEQSWWRRRVAEASAKRRIVEELRGLVGESNEDEDYEWVMNHGDNAQQIAVSTARLLALPYADHPDYRAEWKP